MSAKQEVQLRTECPNCLARVLMLDCYKCKDGWVYAWVDPSSLYLAENPSVQAVVDAASRKAGQGSFLRCDDCGVIATHSGPSLNAGVKYYCDHCYNRVAEFINVESPENISGGGIDDERH